MKTHIDHLKTWGKNGTGLLLVLVTGMFALAQPPVAKRTLVVPVTTQKTTLLVFPHAIAAVDMGSPDILVRPFANESAILKIKAAVSHFAATNLSVLTKAGQLYSIELAYDSLPARQMFSLADSLAISPEKGAVASVVNPITLEQLAVAAASQPLRPHKLVRKNRMTLELRNIFYKQEHLFFVYGIENHSTIPYDIHFTRSYQRDRSSSKRTSQTEQDLTPVVQYFTNGERINGEGSSTLVLVFPKFTMADHKKFSMELYEKKGDRVLRMNISGRTLLHAATW